MITPKRLIISARDPAAASQVADLGQKVLSDPRFIVRIIAQDPAYGLLKQVNVPVYKIISPVCVDPDSEQAKRLLSEVDGHVKEFEPDAVLCGLSSPGEGGVDEALLKVSVSKSYLLQDFWGEANEFFGKVADVFFVLDEDAKVINSKKFSNLSYVTGSPKYAKYKSYSNRLNHSAKGKLQIGFLGQSLSKYPGYQATIKKLCQGIIEANLNCEFIYRPHPREGVEEVKGVHLLLENCGFRSTVHIAEHESCEDFLVSLDVVCGVFSNGLYDSAYINYYCGGRGIVPMALLFDSEMQSLLKSVVDPGELPYFKRDLVLGVFEEDQISSALRLATNPKAGDSFVEASKRFLPNPENCLEEILNYIFLECCKT